MLNNLKFKDNNELLSLIECFKDNNNSTIKNNFGIDTILKENIKFSFIDSIKFIFAKKQKIVLKDKFNYNPEIIYKELNGKKILISYKEGSAKELL